MDNTTQDWLMSMEKAELLISKLRANFQSNWTLSGEITQEEYQRFIEDVESVYDKYDIKVERSGKLK
tara:strand:+ start:105 stop:305 length:201 start_codon:yes stop_codon:yes gene_type:complete